MHFCVTLQKEEEEEYEGVVIIKYLKVFVWEFLKYHFFTKQRVIWKDTF